jgi:hypothetical protein
MDTPLTAGEHRVPGLHALPLPSISRSEGRLYLG